MIYKGKWALVTGASAGLGAGFARSLAAREANLVLVARRQARLEAISTELRSLGAQVEILAIDLARPTARADIEAFLTSRTIEIDVLINNAGYGHPGFLEESPWTDHQKFITLMVGSYVALAHLVLPGMKARGRGRIVNVASLAGLLPGGEGHTLYAPAKAFLIPFSQSLRAETRRRDDINICALCPGFTITEFHDVNGSRADFNRLPGFMVSRAEPVIEGTFKALEGGKTVYVPGFANKVIAGLGKFLPRRATERLVIALSQQRRTRQLEQL